jgi:hypothetical protein
MSNPWYKVGDKLTHRSGIGPFTIRVVQPDLGPDHRIGYELDAPKDAGIPPQHNYFESEIDRDFVLVAGGETESEPKFYTGKCGEDHFKAAEDGKDFLAINVRRGWLVTPWDHDDPKFVDKMLSTCDYGSWFHVRAANMEEAEARANDCEDQYEAFINGWEDWLGVVLTPIQEREF